MEDGKSLRGHETLFEQAVRSGHGKGRLVLESLDFPVPLFHATFQPQIDECPPQEEDIVPHGIEK